MMALHFTFQQYLSGGMNRLVISDMGTLQVFRDNPKSPEAECHSYIELNYP